MKKALALCLLLLLTIVGRSFAAGADTSQPPLLISMSLPEYRAYLKDHNPPLDRLFCVAQIAFFLVRPEPLEKLKKQGWDFRIHKPEDIMASYGENDSNGVFHDYAETMADLDLLQAQYPGLAQVVTMGQTLAGRSLPAIKISDNVASEESEPNIYILGCHHAREWITVELPLLLAHYLLEQYASDPQVQQAVNGAQIYIVPIANPDGLEFSILTYRLWRKNRLYNGNLSWGVDINRNYGYMWGYDDSGSSGNPDGEDYRGAAPFSEKETAAIRDFMLVHPPAASLSYHSYGQEILYPWGYTATLPPDDALMRSIAARMSQLIYQINGRTYIYGPSNTTIYPTNGDSDDWIYGTFRAPAYTIELPPDSFWLGGFVIDEALINEVFRENLPALLYFINAFVPGSAP